MSAQEVVELLSEKNLTLSTAESCTGGMIGEQITAVVGAGEIYEFGFITYANVAKEKILGVQKETLKSYGAVSEQTAREMALGAKRISGSNISVSVTGIAGPGGGSEKKPVGLVYTAVASDKGVTVRKLLLNGTREEVRRQTCESVFCDIINCVNNK